MTALEFVEDVRCWQWHVQSLLLQAIQHRRVASLDPIWGQCRSVMKTSIGKAFDRLPEAELRLAVFVEAANDERVDESA